MRLTSMPTALWAIERVYTTGSTRRLATYTARSAARSELGAFRSNNPDHTYRIVMHEVAGEATYDSRNN